jgi:AhpD family alkylhydroperoxidase
MRVTATVDQIKRAFDQVKDDPGFAESRQLFEAGRMPVEMVQAMALRPPLLHALGAMSEGVYPGGIVERDVKELIILEASRRNQCQFCRESHLALARMLGIADEPLKLLDTPSAMTPRQRIAVEYTRAAMTDSNRIPEPLFAAMRAIYTEPEIVELTATIGLINMLNLFNNCLQVAYSGEYGSPHAATA